MAFDNCLMRSGNFQVPVNKRQNKKRVKEELEERLVSLIASLFGKKSYKLLELTGACLDYVKMGYHCTC